MVIVKGKEKPSALKIVVLNVKDKKFLIRRKRLKYPLNKGFPINMILFYMEKEMKLLVLWLGISTLELISKNIQFSQEKELIYIWKKKWPYLKLYLDLLSMLNIWAENLLNVRHIPLISSLMENKELLKVRECPFIKTLWDMEIWLLNLSLISLRKGNWLKNKSNNYNKFYLVLNTNQSKKVIMLNI